MPKFIDLVVDHRVLFNVHILAGNIGFRLIIIVVRNKIFHRVVREKLAEFGTKLRGQRFIVRQHQRRAIGMRNDIGHSKGFAAAGYTEQRLLRQPCV